MAESLQLGLQLKRQTVLRERVLLHLSKLEASDFHDAYDVLDDPSIRELGVDVTTLSNRLGDLHRAGLVQRVYTHKRGTNVRYAYALPKTSAEASPEPSMAPKAEIEKVLELKVPAPRPLAVEVPDIKVSPSGIVIITSKFKLTLEF